MQSAVVSGNAKQLSSLVEYGVDINAKRGEYGTALIAAAQGAHKDVVKILLEYGAKLKECEARDNGCCQRILSIWNYSYYRRAVTSLIPYNLDRPRRRRRSPSPFRWRNTNNGIEGSSGLPLQLFGFRYFQFPSPHDGHPRDHVADNRFHQHCGPAHDFGNRVRDVLEDVPPLLDRISKS